MQTRDDELSDTFDARPRLDGGESEEHFKWGWNGTT
jgi:hypothetical protein